MLKTEKLKLVSEWDKTFPQSEKVDHKKVTFVNRYGITLAADLPERKPLLLRPLNTVLTVEVLLPQACLARY